MNLTLIFLLLHIAAAVCFGIAAFSGTAFSVALVPLGLLFWVCVSLLRTQQSV